MGQPSCRPIDELIKKRHLLFQRRVKRRRRRSDKDRRRIGGRLDRARNVRRWQCPPTAKNSLLADAQSGREREGAAPCRADRYPNARVSRLHGGPRPNSGRDRRDAKARGRKRTSEHVPAIWFQLSKAKHRQAVIGRVTALPGYDDRPITNCVKIAGRSAPRLQFFTKTRLHIHPRITVGP